MAVMLLMILDANCNTDDNDDNFDDDTDDTADNENYVDYK